MRKHVLFVMLFAAMLLAGPAAANGQWKFAGTWDYNLAIDGMFQGQAATLEEWGEITMNMLSDGAGGEIWDGYTIAANGRVTSLHGVYDYSYQNGQLFELMPYEPGVTYRFEYDTAIDGEPVTFRLEGAQVEENLFAGTATIWVEGNPYVGNFSATRPTPDPEPGADASGGGSSSGCNVSGAALFALLALPALIKKRS